MSTYVIGDVQGCYLTLRKLLKKIKFNPEKDRLWFTGDLVNRGPRSLQVMAWVLDHDFCIQSVLGNHDLHFIARFLGLRSNKKNDSLGKILKSPDCQVYANWLRRQPLIYTKKSHVLVHAGLNPQWSWRRNLWLAKKVEKKIWGKNYQRFLKKLFEKSSQNELTYALNVFTRIRLVDKENIAYLDYSSVKDMKLPGHSYWFKKMTCPAHVKKVFFGHWSDLGKHHGRRFVCLDTGCVWGGTLTAYCIENNKFFNTPMAD